MRKKWMRHIFARRVIVASLLLFQFAFMFFMVIYASIQSYVVSIALSLFSLIVCLYILNRDDKPAYKLSWVILVMSLPVFGGLFYFVFKLQSSARNFTKTLQFYNNKAKVVLKQDSGVYEDFRNEINTHSIQADYLIKTAGFPIYRNTDIKYEATGEEQYNHMLEELRKAEKYIFIEYFIIEIGDMWEGILEILKRKAADGVDIRVIYDDIGCLMKLPDEYNKQLISWGIKCSTFNPFHPIWSTVQNNRDHRKIMIIDGVTAFTGSTNIADEYINKVERFGHWRDSGIMVKGEAAWSFTVMFLKMWDTINKSDEDYSSLKPKFNTDTDTKSDGYIQPYCDSPMDTENVGEHVYLQVINHAEKYLYITTPYLIVDENMISALTLAAKSGVDVRIITPFIPDKRIVHATTRLYYKPLIKSGVRIFEYTPGFMHSKIFVSDDTTATVGTANLDFRSLYLHFECGAIIHKSSIVKIIHEDYLQTLNACHEVVAKDLKNNVNSTVFNVILRICAPFM